MGGAVTGRHGALPGQPHRTMVLRTRFDFDMAPDQMLKTTAGR